MPAITASRADNPKTRLGLPEIKVGLFPGAGGTQRIARMMATADALQFLLKGDQIRLDRAKTMKLVDNVVPAADLVSAAKDWIKTSPKSKQPWDVDGFKLPGGPIWSKMGMMTWPAANALYRKETQDNYPAARAILSSVFEGLQVPFDTALRIESRYFAKIIRSPEAAAMIRSLFVSMQELNKGARRPDNQPATRPQEGRRARRRPDGRGHRLCDGAGRHRRGADRPRSGGGRQGQGLFGEHHGRPDQARPRQAGRCRRAARAHHADAGLQALKGVDMVIEAVFEDRKVKAEATAKAQAVVGDKVVFGSNTSTLPITSLAEDSKDPKNFIGVHFFSPVDKMMLVEIIMGEKTADPALAVALDYVRAIRKTPIVVNDSRGFYTSRVVGTYIREGHLMLTEGVPAAMVENLGKQAGMPVGPLSLNDEVAVDLAWKILKATEADLGAKAIDTRQKALLEEMVEKRGRFGRKNAKGFYDYPQTGPKRLWPGLAELQKEKLDPDTIDKDELKASPARDPGARNRALLRGGRAHRRARGRCRFDPRLRLRAVFGRHALLHRHDGREEVRRAVRAARAEVRRALQAEQAAGRDGGQGRELLRALCARSGRRRRRNPRSAHARASGHPVLYAELGPRFRGDERLVVPAPPHILRPKQSET